MSELTETTFGRDSDLEDGEIRENSPESHIKTTTSSRDAVLEKDRHNRKRSFSDKLCKTIDTTDGERFRTTTRDLKNSRKKSPLKLSRSRESASYSTAANKGHRLRDERRRSKHRRHSMESEDRSRDTSRECNQEMADLDDSQIAKKVRDLLDRVRGHFPSIDLSEFCNNPTSTDRNRSRGRRECKTVPLVSNDKPNNYRSGIFDNSNSVLTETSFPSAVQDRYSKTIRSNVDKVESRSKENSYNSNMSYEQWNEKINDFLRKNSIRSPERFPRGGNSPRRNRKSRKSELCFKRKASQNARRNARRKRKRTRSMYSTDDEFKKSTNNNTNNNDARYFDTDAEDVDTAEDSAKSSSSILGQSNVANLSAEERPSREDYVAVGNNLSDEDNTVDGVETGSINELSLENLEVTFAHEKLQQAEASVTPVTVSDQNAVLAIRKPSDSSSFARLDKKEVLAATNVCKTDPSKVTSDNKNKYAVRSKYFLISKNALKTIKNQIQPIPTWNRKNNNIAKCMSKYKYNARFNYPIRNSTPTRKPVPSTSMVLKGYWARYNSRLQQTNRYRYRAPMRIPTKNRVFKRKSITESTVVSDKVGQTGNNNNQPIDIKPEKCVTDENNLDTLSKVKLEPMDSEDIKQEPVTDNEEDSQEEVSEDCENGSNFERDVESVKEEPLSDTVSIKSDYSESDNTTDLISKNRVLNDVEATLLTTRSKLTGNSCQLIESTSQLQCDMVRREVAIKKVKSLRELANKLEMEITGMTGNISKQYRSIRNHYDMILLRNKHVEILEQMCHDAGTVLFGSRYSIPNQDQELLETKLLELAACINTISNTYKEDPFK